MRRLIKADGTERDLPGPMTIRECCDLINADICDTIMLRHMGAKPLHVMICDDRGYDSVPVIEGNTCHLEPVRARLPVNREATRLYHLNCRPGTTHQIVGDVVVVPDSDFA